MNVIPKGILYLTAGADTQADRLVYLVVGWGKGRECWLLETGAIHGEPREAKVWEELAAATIDNTWSLRDGGLIKIGRMFVDAAFHWEETLRFSKEHWSGGRLFPCKGLGADKRKKSVGGGPILHSENRTKRPPYVMVVNVDVNVAKDQIAGMLAKTESGAGYVHIPSGPGGGPIRGFDQHVIEEFTAESCTVRMVNGFKQYTWHKVAHRSNERLDCLVYALAALVHSRLDLDKLPGPLIEPPAKEQPPQQLKKRPAWGVIHRVALPTETNHWQDAGTVRPEDKPRSQFGVVNRPLEW
jgi:phage terminase large subunit GpA-like protein